MNKFAGSFMLWYLRFFAKLQLFKIRPIIVGVGGSSGKTSLSNFIKLILSQKYKVLETGGKNSETGIPLSVLRIKVENYTYFEWLKALVLAPFRVLFEWERFEVLVAEMGIDGPFEPKNMSYLLKILRPKVGVLTNVSYEHSLYFEGASKNPGKILELTTQEETKLLKALPSSGLAIVNLDDPIISRIRGIRASKLSVSMKNKSSDFFIEDVSVSMKNFIVNFNFEDKSYELKISKPLPLHYAYSFVLAIAICSYFDFKIKDSIKVLEENFNLPPGRMSVFEGKKGTTIIDSSYNNATLAPVIDILELLNKISGNRRKVAILGDMRELGIMSKTLHAKVAEKILDTTDLVILIGPLMAKYVAPALARNKHKFYSFNTYSEAKILIQKIIEKGDIILVKGSQNTLFLERAVEMLLKNPKDKEKLARRGKFWDKIRSQTA